MILPVSSKGRVTISDSNVTVTAEGPLTGVSLRVTGRNVILDGIVIRDADGSSRPAIVDASGSTNLTIRNCKFSGSPGKQQQGVFASGFGGLSIVGTEIGPIGIDPIGGDHCVYLGSGDFVIDGCDFHDAAGAGLQLYPGNAVGVIRDSRLHGNNWGSVVWGPGCSLTVDTCLVYDNHGSRGFGVHADSSGAAVVKNSHLWNNQHGDFHGNVRDGGGNVFAPAGDPVPVSPLRVVAETATTYTLGWDPVPGAAGYWLLIDGKRVAWTADPDPVPRRFAKGHLSYGVQPIQLLGPVLEWKP